MFQFLSLNEELTSAISELGKQVNYILAKVQSRAGLAKIVSMSSDIALPNLTF